MERGLKEDDLASRRCFQAQLDSKLRQKGDDIPLFSRGNHHTCSRREQPVGGRSFSASQTLLPESGEDASFLRGTLARQGKKTESAGKY